MTSPKRKPPMSAMPTDVLTIEEVAELLRCHPVTIKRNADALHIPYRRLGTLWRFSRKRLEAWMRDNEGETTAA